MAALFSKGHCLLLMGQKEPVLKQNAHCILHRKRQGRFLVVIWLLVKLPLSKYSCSRMFLVLVQIVGLKEEVLNRYLALYLCLWLCTYSTA